jgi:hypothetical protein
LAVSHRDTEDAEEEEKKGKGWVLSGPNFSHLPISVFSVLSV